MPDTAISLGPDGPAFRDAFAGFGPPDVQRLLADAGIVRNRAKARGRA